MDEVGDALRRALVAAYRPYLSRVAAAHDIADAVTEGEAWLGAELDALLRLPYVSQRRTPLQVFREAMRFPTAALQAGGVAAPAGQADSPGDVYGIAPATSGDLGEEAWQAHMAWGAAKAAALTTVCWFGRDLADRARIERVAADAGRRFEVAPGDLRSCGRIIVDLEFSGAASVLAQAENGGWPVVAYGPHAQTERLAAARSVGATAVARSRFFGDVARFVGEHPGEAEGR